LSLEGGLGIVFGILLSQNGSRGIVAGQFLDLVAQFWTFFGRFWSQNDHRGIHLPQKESLDCVFGQFSERLGQ